MPPELIAETAVAWDLPTQEVQRIVFWIEANIPEYDRSKVFATLLRRHRDQKLNKDKKR